MRAAFLCLAALAQLALSASASEPITVPLYRRTDDGGIYKAAGKALENGVVRFTQFFIYLFFFIDKENEDTGPSSFFSEYLFWHFHCIFTNKNLFMYLLFFQKKNSLLVKSRLVLLLKNLSLLSIPVRIYTSNPPLFLLLLFLRLYLISLF